MHLTTSDYAVTSVVLVIPLAIGCFFAWKDSKNVNREEYLLGGRDMSILPVSLSMLVTFLSAISLIGLPSEVYWYGVMIFGFSFGLALANVFGCFTMVPLMHPLQLTSIYDYIEMRYQSRAVRIFCTVVGMLQTFFYLVIVIVAPGLALQAAADIPFWMSVVVVGGIGTLYTAIGGIKSVIWTDAFQAFIMFVGLILVIVNGTVAVGGVKAVWTIAEEGGRTSMNKFSPDLRARHHWWGVVIGGFFKWLGNIFSQSTLQRVASVKSVKKARTILCLYIPFMVLFGLLLAWLGFIIYSYFYVLRCDPYQAGVISNINQVSLVFMLRVLQDWPGLAGLYMANIFSGALSSISSGINALAANTVEDILSGCLQGVSERTATLITKVLVVVYGIAIVGFAYLAKAFTGSIMEIGSSIMGAFGSVVVGIFLMGCMVPWTNKYGALTGGILTAALNLWISVGHLFHGRQAPFLPPAPTDQCSSVFGYNNSSTLSSLANGTLSCTTVSSMHSNANDRYEYGFYLYDISYEWYGVIGTIVCSAIILIVSKLTNGHRVKTDSRLILPCLRKLWQLHVNPPFQDKEMESLPTHAWNELDYPFDSRDHRYGGGGECQPMDRPNPFG